MSPQHSGIDDGAAALLRLLGLGVSGGAALVLAAIYAYVQVGVRAPVTWSPEARRDAALAVAAAQPMRALHRVEIRRPESEPDRRIMVPEGFAVDLVYSVPRTQGSWVALCVDAGGRLIASAQDGGLYRIDPPPIDAGFEATIVEEIDSPAGAAQGLAVVDGDLYCVVAAQRADGPGLYRLRDRDGDGRFDETTLLRRLAEGGEHGPHGIVPGPDGLLYLVAGNHTPPPSPERSRVPRLWDEDHLLPRLWDANGHAVGITAPGGWICRTDRDGREFELVAIGMRNAYDLAFDRDGRLYTYDSDMEWDMGAPWYRPTRICLVTSGAEFGWRSGTGKWPAHAPDSLPGILDLGPGSPTGLVFGEATAFPQHWRRALFALDWTFGTIRAVHIEPQGAGASATAEAFLVGTPLPLADAAVNPRDGALYLVLGGRGLPSAIYRVRWAGEQGPEESPPRQRDADDGAAARARTALESFHHPDASAAAIDQAWPLLDHEDRFVRFAARTALEHQPQERWIWRVGTERDDGRRIQATIAAARAAGALTDDETRFRLRASLHAALDAADWEALDRRRRLDLLRARALCITRLGQPDDARRLATALERHYPSGDDLLDRDLCDLLVRLGSPVIVARTVPLMERQDATAPEPIDPELLSRSQAFGDAILRMAAHQPQRQQVHYALALRNAERGWTPDLRRRYFAWFESAKRTSGGSSFAGFLESIRRDAFARLPEAERAVYDAAAQRSGDMVAERPVPEGPGRAWTVDEVASIAEGLRGGRSLERGRRMYAAAMCADCHRLAGEGLTAGPDLSSLAARFSGRDIAEAIVEPSRVVSDQYRFSEILLPDDRVVIGRVVDRRDGRVRVMENLLAPHATVEVAESEISLMRPATLSPMPAHLIDRLNADELSDLLAYLLSGGDPRSPLFEATR